ncbi:MAG: hypothetical protein C4524_02515 [Candidatus Zixiibacteriota bacterium]|nr:MAG: hypothetical protein C4524_02515 [candidate division Zixibacteria bacterium]
MKSFTFRPSSGILFTAAAALLLLGLGCDGDDNGGNGGTGPEPNQVNMQNNLFIPDTITVAQGTEITWNNNDSWEHTVTSGFPGGNTGYFDSGIVGAGGTFNFTFDSVGTFPYYCEIHPVVMRGTVIVE